MSKTAAGFDRFNDWLSDKIANNTVLRHIVAPKNNLSILKANRRLASANIGSLSDLNNSYFNNLIAKEKGVPAIHVPLLSRRTSKISYPLINDLHPMQRILQAGEHAPSSIKTKGALVKHLSTSGNGGAKRTLPNRPITNMELEWARRKYAQKALASSGFTPNRFNYDEAMERVLSAGVVNHKYHTMSDLDRFNKLIVPNSTLELQRDPRMKTLKSYADITG